MRAIDADAVPQEFWEYEFDGKWRGCTIKDLLDSQPTIQPEPHWIPVTEGTLPERNRVVVVCGEKGTWDFGTYRGHGNDIHYWNWKKNTYKRVYWWMYKENALPEPYKGGDGMIEIKMSGLCEDCGVADLFLDCTEFQSYDMGMSYTSKEWEIKCKHQSACNRMYDQTSREVTE